jgi:hypothetical protein
MAWWGRLDKAEGGMAGMARSLQGYPDDKA